MRESEVGQATVELVALVPLLAAITLAIVALFAGHSAREAADQAAVAGAVAQLEGGDPTKAAKTASPDWSRARVQVARGKVTVTIAPRVPKAIARMIDARRTVVFAPAATR